MNIIKTNIKDVLIIDPKIFGDERGYFFESFNAKEFSEKAVKWLRDRVNISYDVETNEDGEPMADSYIDYAKKRLEAANEIIKEFIKSMTE